MRTINVVFEDDEFRKLEEAKESLTWHDFILQLVNDTRGKQNNAD
jgi:hypothetical protein